MSREGFMAVLGTQPLLRGDAIIVLCGEDGERRAEVVPELLARGAAPVVVLSGGKDQPPRWHGAERLWAKLVNKGVAPSAIITETASQNTRDNAVNVVNLALEKGWTRLLLVASGYHAYRAYLTFLQALIEAKRDRHVQLVNVPAVSLRWFAPPDGVPATREALLHGELAKIDAYGSQGHVASYEAGLEYLKYWEERS